MGELRWPSASPLFPVVVLHSPFPFEQTPRRSQLKRVTPARTRQRALQAQQRAAPGSNAVIDLWWLYDEGGLAVLVPYLLTLTQRYKGFAFRVFTVGTPGAPELTANNQERVQKLARLLSKFRIPAEPFAIPLKMQVCVAPLQ